MDCNTNRSPRSFNISLISIVFSFQTRNNPVPSWDFENYSSARPMQLYNTQATDKRYSWTVEICRW